MMRMLRAGGRAAAVAWGMLGLWAGPAQAQICAPFTDVLASSGFCTNIQWLFNRGITQGCTATEYCPANFVRRDQIAAFLNRLATNLFPLNCATGQVMKWNGSAWACASDAAGPANAFVQGGNAFGTTAVLGTADNQPLDLQVNGSSALRIIPGASPNIVGGYAGNVAQLGFDGQTVAGGGGPGSGCFEPEDQTFTRACANFALNPYATVGGGSANVARWSWSTVAGGGNNTAGAYATVGGGINNRATGDQSTVAGGLDNLASGLATVVAGGGFNSATYTYAAVGGGRDNVANAAYSTVPGGFGNHASGDYSVAMGRNAVVNSHGSFVFADGTAGTFTSGVANEFIAGFSGGIGFYTQKGFGTYCRMGAGAGSWSCSSSRDVKRDFMPVDALGMLDRVAALPVTSWRFKDEPASVRHVGPTAQDFRAAFSLGSDDESIAQVDVSGVALAAIQGLNAKLEAKIAEQADELAELRRTVELLARQRAGTACVELETASAERSRAAEIRPAR